MTRANDGRGTGRSVSVRGLAAGDEEALREMFRRLSPQTIYLRFHLPYPRLPESLAVHLARHAGGRSLVAVAGEGRVVGHAMYAGEARREAEVAVVVEDGWQGRGIGKRLLAGLAREAAGRGVETFTGAALGENRRVLGLADAVFAGVRYTATGGSYDIRMPLKGLRPQTGPEGESRPAALAARGRRGRPQRHHRTRREQLHTPRTERDVT